MLSVGLLEGLLERWTRQGASLVRGLRPGLEDHEMDALTAPLGLTLPAEARVWWGWHDGAVSPTERSADRELGPGFPFWSLGEAVTHCRQLREIASDAWGDDADYWWRSSWFPITEQRGAIRLDCAVPPGAPSPIYWAYSHDHDAEGLLRPRVRSFERMVRWWLDALDGGAWSFDADRGAWLLRTDLLSPEQARSGLL